MDFRILDSESVKYLQHKNRDITEVPSEGRSVKQRNPTRTRNEQNQPHFSLNVS